MQSGDEAWAGKTQLIRVQPDNSRSMAGPVLLCARSVKWASVSDQNGTGLGG